MSPADGSPDLGARLRGSVMGCEALARFTDEDGAVHEYRHSDILAIQKAERCADCWSLLVAAIRAETLEEAAKVCDQHAEFARDLLQQNPSSIHVGYRTGRAEGVEIVAAELRALTGSQTPNDR